MQIKYRFWNTIGRFFEESDRIAVNKDGDLILYDYETGEWSVTKVENTCLTINRFSGLKDKNGKEIYEGDIVKSSVIINRIEKGIFLVRWNNFLCNFALDWKGEKELLLKNRVKYNGVNKDYNDWDTDFAKLTGAKSNKLEIIGNIFENSELLKHE